jgi:hypothetical protein
VGHDLLVAYLIQKTRLSVVPLARTCYDVKCDTSIWQKLIGPRAGRPRIAAFAFRSDGGKLYIGYIDHTVYDGSIRYYKCDPSSSFWMIKDAIIHIGLQTVVNQRIIFDTTSQFIRGPQSEVQQIYDKELFLKSEYGFHEELGLYTIPCDIDEGKLPKIGIRVGHSEPWWWTTGPELCAFSLHSLRDWTFIACYSFKQTIPTHPDLCFGLLAAHTKNTVTASQGEHQDEQLNQVKPNDWLIRPYVRTSLSEIEA